MMNKTKTHASSIPRTPIRFLFYVSRPHVWWAFVALAFVTLAQSLSSFAPYLFKEMIDQITTAELTSTQVDVVVFWGTLYILLLSVMWLSWRGSGFIGLEWGTRAEMTAYNELYKYLTLHSHAFFSDRFAGSLSNKVSHAADGMERLIEDSMWHYYPGVLNLLASSALMFVANVYIGLIFFSLVVFIFAINVPIVRYRRPHVIAYAESSSAFRGMGIDVLTNISAVRQYARRKSELKRLSKKASERRALDVRQWRMSESAMVLNNIVIIIFLTALLAALVHLFKIGSVTVGDIVLVLTLIFNTSFTLTFVGQSMNSAVRVYGEIEEGLEEILVKHEVVDSADAVDLIVAKSSIEFKDVTFSYENEQVFDNFNLTIPAGQKVGLVGHSGAGKTTLVSLLLRQHDIDKGEISIDGSDVSHITQESLREAIAVVPQDPALFHRSIKENIMYGNPSAKGQQIINVARMAEAHEFVSRLPQGYETLVGERGVKLSGGQRQRVAIARAMLKDAPILVLDEATSSLDSESEGAIQEALERLMEGKTVLAVAHRLSTLRKMDKIVVIEEGKIVESGTHNELIKWDGIYAKLWNHQAGGFIQD